MHLASDYISWNHGCEYVDTRQTRRHPDPSYSLPQQFPLIHDYWRRQVDATLEGTITYLQREDVRERGLPALVGIVDQISELPHQIEQAQLALRRQLLVFIGHCGLYLVVILPVAIKLLSLVSEQMRALVS